MRDLILGKLSYKGEKRLLMENQNTDDIINQLLIHHRDHAADYDKICMYFLRETPEKTMRAIFDFLKKNVDYVVESEENQKLKTPGGIIYTGKTTGSDCKNYSLFINGVIDGLNRRGKTRIPFCYRFANYRIMDTNPQHVFAVAYPGTKSEIWIDPVLPSFNYRKSYYSKIDKKPMALYSVSGIDGIGRSRAERKQKRAEKKKARRSGEDCKGRTALKFAPPAILARKAFLLLVRLNFRQMGRKMYYVLANPQTRIKALEKWCKFGGNARVLKETVLKTERKLRSRGKITGNIDLGIGCCGMIGVAPAGLAAAWASAQPIILAMTSLMAAAAKLAPQGSKAREILETGSDVAADVSEAGESLSSE